MSSKLKIASLSDVHLGHPNTTTTEILLNLYRAFPDTEETGELDIIWFGGDLFDRLLNMKDPNVIDIMGWMFDFLTMCKKRDIMVVVLEGTPSHDWAQNKIIVQVNRGVGADVTYVDTLSIVRHEKLGIDVLYVPDEWRPETDDTWMEVRQLLQAHGLTQVDYTILHGSMAYQLPEHVKSPKHLPERYLGITKHYVFIGHVHKSSKYDRILANGSFDRLSHGEEEPKGHWRVTVGGESGDEIRFVETKGAKIYKTINCTGLELEDALRKLEQVRNLPKGSFVRVQAEKTAAILMSLDVLRKNYPDIRWSSLSQDLKDVQTNLLVDMRATFHQISITRNNIEELLMAKLSGMTSDEKLLSRARARLQEMIQ